MTAGTIIIKHDPPPQLGGDVGETEEMEGSGMGGSPAARCSASCKEEAISPKMEGASQLARGVRHQAATTPRPTRTWIATARPARMLYPDPETEIQQDPLAAVQDLIHQLRRYPA